MAEMSTLNGYELVDTVLRNNIENFVYPEGKDPFSQYIPFPVNADGSIDHGTDGQILVTNADGTTVWIDRVIMVPKTCEDIYYEFYGIDKQEYPYMILIDDASTMDGNTKRGMIAFVKNISDCSLSYVSGSGRSTRYNLNINGLYAMWWNTNYIIWEDAERLSTYFKTYMEPNGSTLTEEDIQYVISYYRGQTCLTNSDEICNMFSQYSGLNANLTDGTKAFCRTLVGVEYIP